MKNFVSNQHIINYLKSDYGIAAESLEILPLGADFNAAVYKAQASDGRHYFVKLKRSDRDDMGVAISELLHAAGIEKIIYPLRTLIGTSMLRMEDFSLIVYPFVEGQDGFNRDLSDNQWVMLGKAMRQVHEIEVPLSIQNKIRRETYSPQWRNFVRAIYQKMTLSGDSTALKLIQFMQEHQAEILRLVDRAEELGHKLQDQKHPFVLCHSDIHGGNVLLHGNDLLYIVDWDAPIMAPKERDLMFIGGGVANVWNKPHEEQLFYSGYGNTQVNPEILAYYRHERIVEDIAEYGQLLLLTSEGGEDRPVMYQQFIDMFKPNGVVDIASKTGHLTL